ncbi:MAG TPA: hypothetical protein VJ111_14415 [Chitinophagaceae bacterium]|nr:hypothetical protein [Chitinophagaceae bacterium]
MNQSTLSLTMSDNETNFEKLKTFFSTASLPATVVLYPGSMITNPPLFISSHINVLTNCINKPVYEVFLVRLIRLKDILSSSN